MRQPRTAPRQVESLVRCRVAGRSYAFDGRDVRFIARSDQISPGGEGAAHVGTLRGREPIPVFALGTLLHPSDPAGEGAHVVVTASGDERIGWLVDRILRAPRETVPGRLPLPVLAGSLARRWFSGLLDEDDAEPTLVCSPAGLDPRAASAEMRLPTAPPVPDGLPPNGAGRGVVALFSSAALPACGASRFAIAGSRIVAVAQSLPTRAVPGTPGHIAALAAWRGNAIPVLDLSGGVGIAPDSARGRHLIVRHGMAQDATVTAIPIDRDVVLHRATHDDACLARPEGSPDGVQLFAVRGEAVALVDLDSLTASYAA